MRALKATLAGATLTSFFLAGPPHASAQSEEVVLSLAQVLQLAQRDPPKLLAAYASFDRARANARYARAGYWPVLSAQVNGGYAYENSLIVPGAPRIDSSSLSGQASVNFDWAVVSPPRAAKVASADAEARGERHAAQAAEREALELAAELYVRARAATEVVEDAEITLRRRTSQLTAIEGLVQSGNRPPVDTQRARIDFVSAQYGVSMRSTEERGAFAALAAAIGMPPTSLAKPAPDDLGALSVDMTSRQASTFATTNRPEVRRFEALLDARKDDDVATISARLPTLGVSATGSSSYLDVRSGFGVPGPTHDASAVVYIRWSGLDPTVWLKSDVSKAEIDEAERQLGATTFTVASEAVAAWYGLEQAKAGLDRAEAVLATAEEVTGAQESRYQAGMASLLELLDVEATEQNARLVRIEARRDRALAAVRLLGACGLLARAAR
jgi:outer membrane protein